MALTSHFLARANALFHPGMGTEHVGPLLHAMACMRRPETVIAVGIGYSTLFLLQALADIAAEQARDAQVLDGRIDDPARREVLWTDSPATLRTRRPRLIAIDDFSEDHGRLDQFMQCVESLGLASLVELHRSRYQDWVAPRGLKPEMVWLDCGHQLDYADLTNRFWPMVSEEGGLMGMHYTYVDLRPDPAEPSIVVPGPWANAAKRQLGSCGIDAGFEMLSIVEPHKHRQGSISLMRKSPEDRCRDFSLKQEQRAFYGQEGIELDPLNIPSA
jgi:hypothetical protein